MVCMLGYRLSAGAVRNVTRLTLVATRKEEEQNKYRGVEKYLPNNTSQYHMQVDQTQTGVKSKRV